MLDNLKSLIYRRKIMGCSSDDHLNLPCTALSPLFSPLSFPPFPHPTSLYTCSLSHQNWVRSTHSVAEPLSYDISFLSKVMKIGYWVPPHCHLYSRHNCEANTKRLRLHIINSAHITDRDLFIYLVLNSSNRSCYRWWWWWEWCKAEGVYSQQGWD